MNPPANHSNNKQTKLAGWDATGILTWKMSKLNVGVKTVFQARIETDGSGSGEGNEVALASQVCSFFFHFSSSLSYPNNDVWFCRPNFLSRARVCLNSKLPAPAMRNMTSWPRDVHVRCFIPLNNPNPSFVFLSTLPARNEPILHAQSRPLQSWSTCTMSNVRL